MSDEENTTAVDNSVDNGDNAPAPTPELTLTEKVAADETGDAAKFAELELRVGTLEATLSAGQSLVASLVERICALESAAPAATNEKLEALVEKMHGKMKLLIPMD